jgi:S-DNA-T family DNA segregation ATPase FtsK/SpoIIIE
VNALDLIGAVGAAVLRSRLSTAISNDGVARFMLNRMKGEQVAAITKALLKDTTTTAKIKFAIPRSLVTNEGLPESVLTDERPVAIRNAPIEGYEALLLANPDDDQGTSLQEVALLGVDELIEEPRLWVEAAQTGLSLPESVETSWLAAMQGFVGAYHWTLPQVANYVADTRARIADEDLPLFDALGWALPALQIPRDSTYFIPMASRDAASVTRWRQSYRKLVADRKPLLVRQRSSRQIIDSTDLSVQLDQVKDQLQPPVIAAMEQFIEAPAASWGKEAAALAEFEWANDNVLLLFSTVKKAAGNWIEQTEQHFEYDVDEPLSEKERDYLKDLKQAKPKEPREEDVIFFEDRRDDLGKNQGLRAKWEKFIFGRPIETDDFLEGLLRVIERLHGQIVASGGARSLEVRAPKWAKGRWLDLNADVITAFSLRYRGLPTLMGQKVKWIDCKILFNYEAFLEETKKKRKDKYKQNVSTARASRHIKFDISLIVTGPNADRVSAQLVWRGDTSAVGLELFDDLDRLIKQPFVQTNVARQTVSRKGGLQSVSLADVTTLQPVFSKDSGSLIPRVDQSTKIDRLFATALKAARQSNRLTYEGETALEEAWSAFAGTYRAALSDWKSTGAAGPSLLTQAERYADLLKALNHHAPGDINRVKLWQPVLALGCAQVTGGAPAAIIAPWHPLRLATIAVRSRAVAGLTQHILSADEVNFGDSRLFFNDICAELRHPFYPEIAVGYDGDEPILLTETATLNDYSLMERPIRTSAQSTTDVDPRAAAAQIKELLERYLILQPHQKSNLSIMLFNCDAARLPLATINVLANVHEEDEMHCNVLVRHRERAKLGKVYGELLERAESDPDALVVSETSRNFMSKLRIGVMLEGGPSGQTDDKGVDIAFLHDVVSRQAKEEWIDVSNASHEPSILDHMPARWSYRRVTAEDELKATTYLACPRQPREGWAYLDAVATVIQRKSHPNEVHTLPARQISFQDQGLKGMFDEAHGLADWVATYDDLLDKRQLAAQGIKVIRYRRQSTHGRNVIVSSTSDMRILHVLVRRRLAELGLGLSDERLAGLTKRLIDDACRISGDIALRAAKQGVSAGELIGLVLSQALVAEEIGAKQSVAWFLLDDYASWLGQREERIADLMALSFGEAEDGSKRLRVVITEAKYVGDKGTADAQHSSRQQLRDTVRRVRDALFGDPGRLDRDLWLSRISDLLLDGTTALGHSQMLEAVRDGVRRGAVQIDLRGYSHVFVSTSDSDSADAGEQGPIPEVPNALQETFHRASVRALLLALEVNEPLAPVRQKLGDERLWEKVDYQSPAPRVSWTTPSVVAIAAASQPSSTFVASGIVNPDTIEPASAADNALVAKPAIASIETSHHGTEEPSASATGPSHFAKLVASHAAEHAASSEADEVWLRDTAQKLRAALLSYNLQAKITGTRLTPNAALVRFAGSDRLRVEDIDAKQSALLTTHGLRLIAVSPLPGEIVVAVARPERETVSLWDVWSRRTLNRNAAGINTAFVIGLRELDGEVLYLNLGSAFPGTPQHDPHTLVAGATGSGKSVLIQGLILDIAATNPPSLVHIYLIDPKMGVDYAALERLPHVKGGIVTDQQTAKTVLEELVTEMDRRYELFRKAGCRDLTAFNTKAEPGNRLPMLFLIHDEFAEWMLAEDYKDAVTSYVSRLGVKARAAGIHLIFAAQRPDAGVMPMQLRDNLGNRLILKVSSIGTSEIALGVKGAEALLGRGHMAARLSGEPTIIFAQAPYLSDEAIDEVVASLEGFTP